MAKLVKELVSKMEWDGSMENEKEFILQECKGGNYGSNFKSTIKGAMSVQVLDSVKTKKYIWILMNIYDKAQNKVFKGVLQKETLDSRKIVGLGL